MWYSSDKRSPISLLSWSMDKRCVQCGKLWGIFRQTYFFLGHPIWYVFWKNEDSHHYLGKQNFSYITKTDPYGRNNSRTYFFFNLADPYLKFRISKLFTTRFPKNNTHGPFSLVERDSGLAIKNWCNCSTIIFH